MDYYMWDLYGKTILRSTSSDMLTVKTTNILKNPRYIIIDFQNMHKTEAKTKLLHNSQM